MIIIPCEQKSDEWYAARLGIPTASGFDKILTPTGLVSKQADGYLHELLAEWLTGRVVDGFHSDWMERGQILEAEARAYYELQTDRPVQSVGFIYKDERKLVGCSPDGLFEDSGIEIKCFKPGNHVRSLLKREVPLQYTPQIQGCMWVTGYKEWEFLSYCPDLDPVLIRVKRAEKYIDKLDVAMNAFLVGLEARRQELLARGLRPNEYRKAVERDFTAESASKVSGQEYQAAI